ncbi:hypothetical protein RF11_06916 [Thelohanellus kitauei]|uniref:Uncharacterized protein n=1 Tax=Thelohanellus kitauei TaxID=669202 RepID=A0A0C2JGR9_THEKT|nr:hypothetical protein RF11_06916 [Thelohanellus kitauei]
MRLDIIPFYSCKFADLTSKTFPVSGLAETSRNIEDAAEFISWSILLILAEKKQNTNESTLGGDHTTPGLFRNGFKVQMQKTTILKFLDSKYIMYHSTYLRRFSPNMAPQLQIDWDAISSMEWIRKRQLTIGVKVLFALWTESSDIVNLPVFLRLEIPRAAA